MNHATAASLRVPFVDLHAQHLSIQDEIREAIDAVLADSAFIGGHYVSRFEEQFAAFTGARHVMGVSSGTDALILSLMSLEFKRGFEAIVPANSFIATSEAVTHAGGTPLFCDVDPDNYLLDLDYAAQLVTSRTRVILPVHLYGQMADMHQVRLFADKYDLVVIEDAAQAHGARYQGIGVGELSAAATYSFFPAKNLGAYGDGGAISTNDDALAEKIRRLRNHGAIQKYNHEVEGFNSRMDGIQAAILSVKLGYLATWTRQRQAAAATYHQSLEKMDLPLPHTTELERHVYHLYVIRINNRDTVRQKLSEAGISTGIHYPVALPFLEAYRRQGNQPGAFPVVYRQMTELLSLPLYPEIQQDQIEYVAASLAKALDP